MGFSRRDYPPLKALIIILALTSATLSYTAEVDHFSLPEPVALRDSRLILNAEVEQRIDRALVRANRNEPHLKPRKMQRVPVRSRCNVDRLYESFQVLLARPLIGQVESYAEQSAFVERISIPFHDSIYRDFTWPHSPSLVLSKRLASIVRMGNVYVGTDKFGHFFTEGLSYFVEIELMYGSLKDALLFGEWTESVYFGAETTGVFSFADLVANFQGLRFWNRILSKDFDPLTGVSEPPYVVCEDDRWVVGDTFDWLDYVDPAWDESVNCSLLRTDALLDKMMIHHPVCRTEALPWTLYGDLAPLLFNQNGLNVLPAYLQPEAILALRHPKFMSEDRTQSVKKIREALERWRTRRDTDKREPIRETRDP